MNENRRWLMPVLLVAVLIGSSLLAVVWPSISSGAAGLFSGGGSGPVVEASGPEEVDITNPLSEETMSFTSLQLFGILGAVSVVLLLGTAGAIAGGVTMLNRMRNTQLADDGYTKAETNLSNSQKQYVKDRKTVQPPTGKGDAVKPRSTAIATSLMYIILAYFGGLVIGSGISEAAGSTLANVSAIGTAILCFWYARPERIVNADSTSYGSVPWNMFFVVLSGAVMMGLGVGIMFAVISGQNPFPFMIWDPVPSIDWSWFSFS